MLARMKLIRAFAPQAQLARGPKGLRPEGIAELLLGQDLQIHQPLADTLAQRILCLQAKRVFHLATGREIELLQHMSERERFSIQFSTAHERALVEVDNAGTSVRLLQVQRAGAGAKPHHLEQLHQAKLIETPAKNTAIRHSLALNSRRPSYRRGRTQDACAGAALPDRNRATKRPAWSIRRGTGNTLASTMRAIIL